VSRSPQSVAWLLLLVLMAGFVALTVVYTPWDPMPGGQLDRPSMDEYFTAEQIRRQEALHDAIKWPRWIGLAVGLLTAVALGFSPLGRRLVAAARRRTGRWWLQVPLLVVGFVLVVTAARMPFSIWGQGILQDYGLSTQTWGSWAVDLSKALAIEIGLTSGGLLLLVGLARRLVSWWFLPAAAGAAALVVGLSFAYPVVFEPAFNKFTPMADGPLRNDLLTLAAEDGMAVSEVLVADASRRTSTLNAYVSGFGATKRIVVYDNLLEAAPPAEVEAIVAHELAHAKYDDVIIGTFEGALGSAIAMVALFLALRDDRLRRRVGARSAADPAIVPVVMALAAVMTLATAPLQNTISRHIEARADAHALDLTRDPATVIEVEKRLAVTNISHLEPNPMLVWWFSSHPPTLDRIAMAVAWAEFHGGDTPTEPGR
jgi:STE24 endopeptidase